MLKILAMHLIFLLTSLFWPINGMGVEQEGEKPSDEQLSTAGKDVDKEWVTEKNGEFVALDAEFIDEFGNEVSLRSLIDKPTLILPIYFYCPSSCSKNLANMAVAMNQMHYEAGRDYRPIALSFSETENADIALRAKKNYVKLLYDDFPVEEWKFLTGSRESIQSVTESIGFRFKKMDDETFIHPSAIIAVGADGKIIRYVYGSFIPGDIDMAISSAREGVPALSVKRFLDFCFNYSPGRSGAVFQYVKIAGLLILAVSLAFIFFGRKKKRHEG